ncbi:MAG: hypothetical protein GY938_01100 [Ketobacter sp.]|nr:hypothetical protein [Ketobacter sp.]
MRQLIDEHHNGVAREFARAIGTHANTVSRWQNKSYEDGDSFRPIPDATCRKIEDQYGKPRYWLDGLHGQDLDKPELSTNTGRAVRQGIRNMAKVDTQNKILSIPLLDSKQSLDPAKSIAANEWIEYFPVGTSVCSDNSFFYTVTDESMTCAGHQYSLPVGTDLIVDMDISAIPGDVVLAVIPDTEQAMPRIYKDNGGGHYSLIPLNSYYSAVDDSEIIGVVVSVNIPLRARSARNRGKDA